jgi:asparagine synthase (glutamine-hydrolysing)
MCGFAGFVLTAGHAVGEETLRRMAAALRHRGPDGFGFFTDPEACLVHTRLAIVDKAGGAQPLASADGTLVLAYNGEVYNHHELRRELEDRGHRFRTQSDTEVVLEGWRAFGPALLPRLNGQFALALYDRTRRSLFLARDRFGVRPLFHARVPGGIVFGSEVKGLLASGLLETAPDPRGLDEVFTFWAARPPRTPFRHVEALEPGGWGRWDEGRWVSGRWYEPDFGPPLGETGAIEALDEILEGAVAFRLRADVPVGGYLSGGLDSSITCALASARTPHRFRTFSITFEEPAFDESESQQAVAAELGSLLAAALVGSGAIAEAFPEVIWHVETPLVRTAPVPLYLLGRLTRAAGITVVLTGEGADELFYGYDLFKEVALREFCLRPGTGPRRARLFERIYPFAGGGRRAGEFWARFFLEAGPADDPLLSHLPRFRLTGAVKDFYSGDFRAAIGRHDPLVELRRSLPDGFRRWTPLQRAAWLELTTLLSPYLLAAQGDRVSLAHGVEARYPFLDHRLFEFAARLPDRLKLLGLREKRLLRQWSAGRIPAAASHRPKRPYRAPDAASFFRGDAPAYVRELLAPDAIADTGIFEPHAVAGLVRRCAAGQATGFRENQALVAILSTQLWHRSFFPAARPRPLAGQPDVWLGPAVRSATPAERLTLTQSTP